MIFMKEGEIFKFLGRAIANIANNRVYISIPYKFDVAENEGYEDMNDVIDSCLDNLFIWLERHDIAIKDIRFEDGPSPWMEFYVGDEVYCAECLSNRWQVILPLLIRRPSPPTYEQMAVLL